MYCYGSTTEFQLCNQASCPAVNGGWSDWSEWGTCSATCGTGLQHRNRTCSNPAPEPRGRPCVGDFSDHQLCDSIVCQGTGIGFSVYNPQNVSATPLKFARAHYNNYYNTTSGEFVCTKQGVYYFQSTLIGRASVTTSEPSSYCWLYINSVNSLYTQTLQKIYIYSSTILSQATGSVVLDLLPGDRMYIGGCENIALLDYYSTFSGFPVDTGL